MNKTDFFVNSNGCVIFLGNNISMIKKWQKWIKLTGRKYPFIEKDIRNFKKWLNRKEV